MRAPVGVGSTATFHYRVTNDSDRAASDAVFRSSISEGLTSPVCTSGRGVCSTDGRNMRVNLGSIEPGAQVNISIQASVGGLPTCPNCVGGGSPLRNTAAVSAAQGDPAPGNNYTQTQVELDSPCHYTLSRSRVTASGTGGEIRVDVATGPACEWDQSAVSGEATITPSGRLRGSATVSIGVPPNPGGNSRTLAVMVAGQSLEVQQTGLGCAISLTGPASLPDSGGTFQVQVQAGCAWQAVGGPDWLRVGTASGNGNGSISFTATANQSIITRIGFVEVGGQTYTVTQRPFGAPAGCASVSPNQVNLPRSGGQVSVVVTAGATCLWTAASDDAWIGVIATGPQAGSATVPIQAAMNSSGQRSGSVQAGGQTVSVVQEGAAISATPPLLRFLRTVGGAAPGAAQVSLTGAPGTGFQATAGVGWLGLTASGAAVPATMQVSPAAAGLSVGTYTANVDLAAGGQTLRVPATLVVFAPGSASQIFSDVPAAHPWIDYIFLLNRFSVTVGCRVAPLAYCPADTVTQAQMAAFVIRALLGEDFAYPMRPYFTDMPASNPLFKYVQKMRELNINPGCGGTLFCPNEMVTRAQMATYIARGLYGETFPYPAAARFNDVGPGDPIFKYVQKIWDLGVTQGCSATSYCPAANVTREQMSAFLNRSFFGYDRLTPSR
jgi:hypothetical protein